MELHMRKIHCLSALLLFAFSTAAFSQQPVVYPVYTASDSVFVKPVAPPAGYTGVLKLTDCSIAGTVIPVSNTAPASPIASGTTPVIAFTLTSKLSAGTKLCAIESFTGGSPVPNVISVTMTVSDRPAIKIGKVATGDKSIVVTPIPPGPYSAMIDVSADCPPYTNQSSLVDASSSKNVDANGDPVTLTLHSPLTPAGGKVCAVETYQAFTGATGSAASPQQDVSDAAIIADTVAPAAVSAAPKPILYPVYTTSDSVFVTPVAPAAGYTGSLKLTDCSAAGTAIAVSNTNPAPIASGAASVVTFTLANKLATGTKVCAMESYAGAAPLPPGVNSASVTVANRPTIKIGNVAAGDKSVSVTPISPGPYSATVDVFADCPPYTMQTSLVDSNSSRSVDANGDSITLTLQSALTPVGGKVCAVETYQAFAGATGTSASPQQDVSEAAIIAETADAPPPGYDWGRVRAYFTFGGLLSQQEDQFSHVDMFLAFRLDKTYIQTKNLDATGSHSWRPGFNSYFEPRLTALPVSVQPCAQSSNSSGNASASSSSQCANSTSNTGGTTDTTEVFLNSQKSARLTFGVYAPFLVDRWAINAKNADGTIKSVPYALYLAPLAKTGFDTSINGLNQTQQQGSTPTQVQPVGNSGSFYKFWEFGFRLGHYGLSKDQNVAHDQISNLDVGFGRFSNMASLLCPTTSYKGNGVCSNPDPTVSLPYSTDFRMHVEGLLEVPGTGGLSVGFSTNVATTSAGHTHKGNIEYVHIRPNDDLRFLFGYKVDISKIAAKLAGK
jgi:hypothetical protein